MALKALRDQYHWNAGLNAVPESGLPKLSLLDLSQRAVSVSGQADLTVKSEVTIKVDGPGQVTNQTANGGKVSVPLNSGKGMSDTGVKYPEWNFQQ